MRKAIPVLTLALALAACGSANNTTDYIGNEVMTGGGGMANVTEDVPGAVANTNGDPGNAAGASTGHDAWLGRWTGVEGTYLVITKAALPDHYRLEMQYTLDSKGSYDGIGADEGIAFTRPDGKQVLRASDGHATGLKYLAGKKDCLKVKDGEGYCRD